MQEGGIIKSIRISNVGKVYWRLRLSEESHCCLLSPLQILCVHSCTVSHHTQGVTPAGINCWRPTRQYVKQLDPTSPVPILTLSGSRLLLTNIWGREAAGEKKTQLVARPPTSLSSCCSHWRLETPDFAALSWDKFDWGRREDQKHGGWSNQRKEGGWMLTQFLGPLCLWQCLSSKFDHLPPTLHMKHNRVESEEEEVDPSSYKFKLDHLFSNKSQNWRLLMQD